MPIHSLTYCFGHYCDELDMLFEVFNTRILSNFDNLEQEARQLEQVKFDEYIKRPYDGQDDRSVFADMAHEAADDFYCVMSDMRQIFINSFCIALFCSFEQQISRVCCELLEACKKGFNPHAVETQNFNLQQFVQELNKCTEINAEKFTTWQSIEELHLVANIIKHGEGRAAKKLRKIKPELFENPSMPAFNTHSNEVVPVREPLLGGKFYVSSAHIATYHKNLVGFWKELENELKKRGHS